MPAASSARRTKASPPDPLPTEDPLRPSADRRGQSRVDGLVEVLAKLPQASDPAFEAKAPAARRELAKGVAKLRGLQAKASPGSARKIGALVADLEARSAELREAVARMLDL